MSTVQTEPEIRGERESLELGYRLHHPGNRKQQLDVIIKWFFAANALVALVVLGLITFSLFWDGIGFLPEEHENLRLYRLAGLEYVDYTWDQLEAFRKLNRSLDQIRVRQYQKLEKQGLAWKEINRELADFDAWQKRFKGQVKPLDRLIRSWKDRATTIKSEAIKNEKKKVQRKRLLREGKEEEAQAVSVERIRFEEQFAPVLGQFDSYLEINQELAGNLRALSYRLPTLRVPGGEEDLERFSRATRAYVASFPQVEERMTQWNQLQPISWAASLGAFFFGTEWITNSSWQDYYGFVPLLVGSTMVSMIALVIAIPLGIGAAIYVNQFAGFREQHLIKPYIEFISAIPSVVLGFFGILVFGETVRWLSMGAPVTEELLQNWWSAFHPLFQAFHAMWAPIASWVPFFPIQERLNAFTAGGLLALMAVPTIFTLAEDALNNVPRSFKEASLAMGATRLQTTIRIIIPTALSGLVSAILLGLGRVIGETMVVLLCAGGRIDIPDFLQEGLGGFFQPVHTMTGIIAQEMGEVEHGSIHFRALFMVGLVLFFISLLINFTAQMVVKKFRVET